MTVSRPLFLGCIVFAVFCLISSAAVAQNATLTGNVTDAESGEPLLGANVVVRSTSVQTGAATDVSGDYEVPNVPAGSYTVTVSYIGYERQSQTNVVFTAGETRSLDFFLNPLSIQLNPISISASRRPEKTLEAPASISVLEARELTAEVMPSTAAILKNVVGVDMATTGIDRREIVLRGFNNAFSGATYILTDYRQAAVPSLDVNLHSVMPNLAIDLERIEIVRGPATTLYGAGVDAGVIHYITKSPFTEPGTTVSISGGERSSFASHFRHAGQFSEKVAYKVTGQYAQADDWKYDVKDSLDLAQLRNPVTGDTTFFNRDYRKVNVNGSLHFQIGEDATLIANGGYSRLKAAVLSGIGTVQADGFGYSYGQLRLRAGNFFAQTYLNKNEAGDSFVYGQAQADGQVIPVVDKSTEFNVQTQYDLTLADGKENLIFGADFELTAPQTKGTIYGRNDSDDQISEYGAYVQSQTRISSQLDFSAALRGDYNNIEDKFQLSPRAAFVFKPTPEHNFRATYNRAYDLPGSNSLFLDLVALDAPIGDTGFSVIGRARGSKDGYTFNQATAGGVITASSLFPAPQTFGQNILPYSAAGVPTQNVPLAVVYGAIYSQLAAAPPELIQALLIDAGFPPLPLDLISQLVGLLSPVEVQPGVPFTNVQGFGTSVLAAAPEEVKPLKATITQTLEVGYKGLLADKVLLALDAYYTRKKNFVSGVERVSPVSVYQLPDGTIPILDNNELTSALSAGIAGNPALAPALGLFGLTPQQVAGLLVALGDEGLAGEGGLRELMSSVPAGVVQPDQNQVPGEVLNAYRNFGDIDFWGIDAAVQIIATDRLTFFGNASYISDDFFNNKDLGEANPATFLALNATQFKAKGGFSYGKPGGFSFNAAGRYTKAFPVSSGPYHGNVPVPQSVKDNFTIPDVGGLKNYFLLDLSAGYDLNAFSPGLRLDITLQNVFNNKHRQFIGAPQLGRLALARLTYTLP